LHLTYTALNSDLAKHIEESRRLAMKHIGKASKIDELLIERPSDRVYGILYDFQGETASDFQFFLTDSTDHFLRGALYFNVSPNKDSLAPVIEYVERDIRHLVGGLRWRS
jgi:gliding motility-associated lipoprotein GldD